MRTTASPSLRKSGRDWSKRPPEGLLFVEPGATGSREGADLGSDILMPNTTTSTSRVRPVGGQIRIIGAYHSGRCCQLDAKAADQSMGASIPRRGAISRDAVRARD